METQEIYEVDRREEERQTCEAITLEGKRCPAAVVKADGHFCWAHSTVTAGKREGAKGHGGRRPLWREHPQEPVDLSTLESIRHELEGTLANLKQGDFSPQAANSMVAVLRQATALIVGTELEQEIDALMSEERTNAQRKTG